MLRSQTLVLSALLSAAIACESGGPAPADAELLERFRTREAEFERLAKDPDDKPLQERLGVLFVAGARPQELRFAVWHQKFVGAGGRVKGFLHGSVPPARVVPDIDIRTDPPPADIEIYRTIKDGWYLYYSASN